MFDKTARDALAAGIGMGGKGCIGHMRTACGAVGADMAGAQDAAIQFGHEGGEGSGEPILQRFVTFHVARHAIGLTGAIDRAQDVPDRVMVVFGRGADHRPAIGRHASSSTLRMTLPSRP